MYPIEANKFSWTSRAPRHSAGGLPVRCLIALFDPVLWQMRDASFIAERAKSSTKNAYLLFGLNGQVAHIFF